MADRPSQQFRPRLEDLEPKRPLTAGASVAAAADLVGHHPAASHPAAGEANVTAFAVDAKPNFGYLLYRITNPTPYNNKLVPPFGHVRVQPNRPIPGQTYNILFVSVRNGTRLTFNAANSNFQVRYPNARTAYPILTGDQQWRPGERFVFYVLTKQYYPLPSQVHSGFEFSLDGARSIGLPGPSGIFLRLKYNPATFDQTLDRIVAYGVGNQGGVGEKFGLPNTSIYEFVNSRTNRNDFSGYF